MKPQSLQDAIKAKALKKEQARQSAGWTEPYVKKYEITAEDLVKTPSQPAAVASSSPPVYNSSSSPALQSNELLAIRKMMEEIKIEVKQQRVDISTLQTENKELRERVDKLQAAQANNATEAFAQSTTTAASPALVEPSSPKKAKAPASPAPHTIADLAESQRLDKVMRHFMRTQEGLYDTKYMSIREEAEGRLICFKNKIYIPLTLREKTIQYYKSQHASESDALAVMRKNCCWPDLEKDFFAQSQ